MSTRADLQIVEGLEAIIDAAAGVLAEQSLESTLRAMARALQPIVPYTSLAVYEVDDERRELVAVFAEGVWVEETLADRPALHDSISGKAFLSGEVIVLEPDHPWMRQHQIPGTPDDETEAFMVAPLMAGDRAIGTLNVWREDVDARFTLGESRLIRRFATLAAIAYANAHQRERLRHQALTDELTGLYNRRLFFDRLTAELARTRREGASVALVVLDVDDFKAVNDRYGHPAGDETLRLFSRVLTDGSRTEDVVCRTGGEEFAVILPDADLDRALAYAERTLAAVRALRGPDGIRLTASVGVAVAPDDALAIEALCRVADDRLLTAKAAGKDCVVTASAA